MHDLDGTLYPNIQFTIEHQHLNTLPFLNVLVTNTSQAFRTSVFRKPIFTPSITNFYTSSPLSRKTNTILAFIHIVFGISYSNFHNEFEFLHNLFNAYNSPPNLIIHYIFQFFSNKYHPPFPIQIASKKIMYFSFPYFHMYL